jgi:hypothetical protein
MRTMRVRDSARGLVFALYNKVAGPGTTSGMHCLVRRNVEPARGSRSRGVGSRRSRLRPLLHYPARQLQPARLAFVVSLPQERSEVYIVHCSESRVSVVQHIRGRPCNMLVHDLRVGLCAAASVAVKDSGHHHHHVIIKQCVHPISAYIHDPVSYSKMPAVHSMYSMRLCSHALHPPNRNCLYSRACLPLSLMRACLYSKMNPTKCTFSVPEMRPAHTTQSTHSTGARISRAGYGKARRRAQERRGCLL